MGRFNLLYKPFGKRAILVEWPQKIDPIIQKDVWFFKDLIEQSSIKSILEVIIAYNSITIVYDFTIENVYNEILTLKTLYKGENKVVKRKVKLWDIPVCYHVDLALDLVKLSALKNMSMQQIIAMHSEVNYSVSFIGFLPGFLYLSGLDQQLTTPRKNTPDKRIPKGSVAIGENQTGIYPMESPGGWHVIGVSPLNFFDVNNLNPCFVSVGDQIKFTAITNDDYLSIKSAVENSNFIPKHHNVND